LYVTGSVQLKYYHNIEGGRRMKKGYVFLTTLFIMGTLIMTSGQAMAGWSTSPAAIQFLSNANSAGLYSAKTLADISYTLTGAEATLATGSVLTLTLTGGAVWSGTVALTATSPGGVTWAPIGTYIGTATAQFLCGTATTPGPVIFNTTGTGINLVGATSSVDVLFSLATSTSTPITTAASLKAYGNYLFTPVAGITVTNTVKEAILDVLAVPSYSKFENGALYGGVTVGTIGPPSVGTGLGLIHPGGALTIPPAALAAKKVLITLTGDFTDITKVTMSDAVFQGCDSALSTTSGVLGQFLINSTKTEAYATNPAVLAAAVNCSPNFYVLGTSAQTARSFTAKVENIADGANYLAYTWQSPLTNYRLLRNGTFFSANSLGPLNNIKISDLSGRVPTGGAKVLISAWDAAGVKLSEASGITDILVQNNSTVTLSGSEIAARFVGTPMKYEVAVQSTNSTISNIKKDPTTGGITSTVYTNTTGGGAL
jgi:hypothetical protein